MRRSIVVLSLAMTSVSCASSQMTLTLDLYQDDPTVKTLLSLDEAVGLANSLRTTREEARSLGDGQSALAHGFVSFYEELARAMVGEGEDSASQLTSLKGMLKDHDATLDRRRGAVEKAVAAAESAIQSYITTRKDLVDPIDRSGALVLLQQQVRALINDVSASVDGLSNPGTQTDFESYHDFAVGYLVRGLARPESDWRIDETVRPSLSSTIRTLAATAGDLEAQGLRVGRLLRQSLDAAVTELDSGRLRQSVERVAAAATSLPASLSIGDRGTAALAELVRSTALLHSQIDRLQDPADPVWRVVSHPDNEEKWNTTFAETYFYAEGNSSVVVVRDSPFSFRVQRGDNDPTALIRSQLEVARAIGDAALTVAGASIGASLPLALESDGQTPAITTSPEGVELARRREELRSLAQRRNQAASAFSSNLLMLRDRLREIEPDADGAAAQLAELTLRLRSLLGAYQPFFAGSGSGSPPPTGETADGGTVDVEDDDT